MSANERSVESQGRPTSSVSQPVPDSSTAKESEKAVQTRRRKLRFRDNFRQQLQRSHLPLEDLADRTGIDLSTLRRWRREGVAQPKHEHIESLARVFHLRDPWSLMSGEQETSESQIDQATNPMVEEVGRDRPDLFRHFSDDDWHELYSVHGVGGALTYDGVVQVADRINQKREVRRKFEAVLETHHFATLAALIDVLYRDTSVH